MTPLVERARAWLSTHHLAQVCLLIHPLIVLRTGGEYLRLKLAGSGSLPQLIEPLFISLAVVGVVAMVSLLLYFNGRERTVIAVTLAGIAALIVYKLTAMPALE